MGKSFSMEYKWIASAGRKIRLLILKPVSNKQIQEKTPGILWIHGGGYATGMAEMVFMGRAFNLVRKYGAVVVAPSYRLSWEKPYPAALEDCYASLLYLKEHAEELGINKNQIMVGGESAGGGLTAAVCMYARDRGEVNIAFQMPLYPMIDNEDTESSRDNHAPVWNTKRNHSAWKMYLKKVNGEVSPYAAPARQTDYSNLPPAYTFVGDIEPFYVETLTYIENLKKAGVKAMADVYPDCFHAFDMMRPYWKVSKKAVRRFERVYQYAAEHFFAENG